MFMSSVLVLLKIRIVKRQRISASNPLFILFIIIHVIVAVQGKRDVLLLHRRQIRLNEQLY